MAADQITVELIARTEQYNAALAASAKNTEVFGARAATATSASAKGFDTLGSSMQSFMAQGRAIDALLGTQATTLADVANRQSAFSAALKSGVLTQSEYAAAAAALQAQATKITDGLNKAAAAAEKVALKYDPAAKAAKGFAADQLVLANAFNSGVITSEKYTEGLAKIKAAAAAAATGTAGLRVETGLMQRELGVLAGELAKGNYAQFDKSLITLTRSTGILNLVFSSTGAIVAGVVAVLGTVAAAFVSAEEEENSFNKALILTNQNAGLTVEQLREQVGVIGSATGSYSKAQEALTQLAADGKRTGAALENAAQGVVSFSQLTGKSVQESITQFDKIGSASIPQLVKLNEQYHFLTGEIIDEIDALQRAGRESEAATVKENAFADAMIDRANAYNSQLTGIAARWRDIKSAIDQAWNSAKDFFNTKQGAQATDAGIASFLGPVLGGAYLYYANKQNDNAEADAKAAKAAAEHAQQQNKLNDALVKSNAALDADTAALVNQASTYKKTNVEIEKHKIDLQLSAAAATLSGDALAKAQAEINAHGKAALAAAAKLDALVASHKRVHDSSREAQNGLEQLQAMATSLSGHVAGSYAQAWSSYVNQVAKLDSEYAKAILITNNLDAAQKALTEGVIAAKAAYDALMQSMQNANDIDAQFEMAVARATQDLDNQIRLWGMSEQAKREDAEANKLVNQALAEMGDVMGPLTEKQQKFIDSLAETGKQTARLTEAERLNQQATQDWTNIWVQGGNSIADTFASILVNGGSLFNSLVSLAKNTVQQIIAYFAKLAIINPILNALFGGSSGWTQLAQFGAGAIGGGGAGAAGGGGGLVNTGMQLLSGGNSAYGWLGGGSGSQSIVGSVFGSGDFDIGPMLTSNAGNAGIYGTGGTLGGIMGGYYLGQRYLGGTGGGIAGAAAIGTAAYFVPIIGWIAGAIALIDSLTGGGLLGTDADKFQFGKQQAFIGPNGATVVAGADYKGKKPLFGGSYHEWKDLPVDQKTQDAWNQFVTQLITGNEGLAKKLGTEAGQIVSAEFDQIFDKKGNVTSTSSIVNGQTYNEDAQHFQMRVIAETMLSTLDNVSAGISQAVDQYRIDAEVLYNVTNQLANAAVFLHNGGQFLALGADQSLTALLALAQGAQQFGETIDQTLQRIVQAQQQYDQFVGQFKTVTYVDDFEATLSGINQQMLANINTANQLAQAAGAEGASEQDLANIHQYAAKQMAQAIQALENSAQSLAFSLGLTTMGSLDQVNSEIAQLQAKANQGASAIGGFGNAMQQAAQRATEAMNLLLGDLSPLNDAEKLQRALQGLRAGTVTAEQVLQIGRRLYASSQAYNDLFSMVQAMDRGGTNAAVSVAGSRGGGLTGAESQRLSDLLKQQQQLQAAAQLQQYQTLAQQIAEIASAKGEDWQQVVADMGIDLKAFEKGLGMTEEQLGDYIASIQAQTDSAGENTQSIVDAINAMSDAVVVALGGTPQHSQPGSQQSMSGGTRGHSGHGRDIGRDIGRGIIDVIFNNGPRNLRPRQTMTMGGG